MLKVKLLEAMCEAIKLKLPRGKEGTKQTTFLEGSMDVFVKMPICTFSRTAECSVSVVKILGA